MLFRSFSGGSSSSGSAASEWRLIADITTTEEVNSVIINQDMDGNAFSLKEIKMYCCFKGTATNATSTGWKAIRVLFSSSSYDQLFGVDNLNVFPADDSEMYVGGYSLCSTGYVESSYWGGMWRTADIVSKNVMTRILPMQGATGAYTELRFVYTASDIYMGVGSRFIIIGR